MFETFETREEFVDAVNLAGFDSPEGSVVYAAGHAYFRQAGASHLTDLPDYSYVGTGTAYHFGASGTGQGNDAPAINALIGHKIAGVNGTSSQLIRFGAGQFRITESINLTNIRAGFHVVDATGATIIAATNGGVAVDMANSRFITWNGGMIFGSGGAPPAIGLQLARPSTNAVSDGHTFNHLVITGEFTVAGLYNYASENMTLNQVRIRNSSPVDAAVCMALDRSNLFIPGGYQSAFASTWGAGVGVAAPDTPASFNEQSFFAVDLRRTGSTSAAAIWSSGGSRVQYWGSYVASLADSATIVIASDGSPLNGHQYDMHVETQPRNYIRFTRAKASAGSIVLNDFVIKEHALQAEEHVFAAPDLNSVKMNQANLRFSGTHIGVPSTAKLFDEPDKFRVNGVIHLANKKQLWNAPAAFNGDLFVDGASDLVFGAGSVRIFDTDNDSLSLHNPL